MNGSLGARTSVLLLLSLFLVNIKATDSINTLNDSIKNSTIGVDYENEHGHNSANLTSGNSTSAEIPVPTNTSTNTNFTEVNTGIQNDTVISNLTDSIVKENHTDASTESDKNVYLSTDNSKNENISQSSINNTNSKENNTNIDDNTKSRVESDNKPEQVIHDTKHDDKNSSVTISNQNKTEEIEKVTIPRDAVENKQNLDNVHVETNTNKIHSPNDSNTETNSSKDSKNQNEIPSNSNTVETSHEKEGIYKYENFNLTNEIERLYNSSNYEETEEEKLFRDAEKVHNDMKSAEESEEVRLRKEWEEEVSNFDATDILTVKLRKRQNFNFYSDVTEVPSLYKIAYYVSNENLPIDFYIYDQRNKMIHKTKNRGQIFKELLIETPGTYKFVLDNSRFSEWKRVSFAVHTGNNTDTSIKTDQFDNFTTKINNVDNKLEEFKLREKLIIKKMEGHFETTKSHNNQIAKYSIIEMVTMILILFIQLFYLKHLMSKIA